MTRLVIALACIAAVLGCASDRSEAAKEQAPAATVENPAFGEAALTRVVLAPESEQRLGIAVAPIEWRRFPRTRTTGGEIVVPTRLPGDGGPALVLGAALGPADRLRAADALIAADEAVERARIDGEAATAALARAERLLRAEAASVRSVEEVRARLGVARAALTAAEARRKALAEATFGSGGTLWVRVPMYAGDLNVLAAEKPVLVAGLGDAAGTAGRPATPVDGPRTGNPDSATIDLFYAVGNGDARLRPGEKVTVTLVLGDEEETLVTRWSAIVHDVHGGEWLYENVAPHAFVRRRVQVRYVIGQEVALASGPAPGASIVVAGAAELFGVEFGAGG